MGLLTFDPRRLVAGLLGRHAMANRGPQSPGKFVDPAGGFMLRGTGLHQPLPPKFIGAQNLPLHPMGSGVPSPKEQRPPLTFKLAGQDMDSIRVMGLPPFVRLSKRSKPQPQAEGPQPSTPKLETSRKFNPFSAENLELGPNAIYVGSILGSSRRTKLPPHSLAAIVGGEANIGANKVWDPNSVNDDVLGLTQFDTDTWLHEANRRGTFLNEFARSGGYLDARGKVRPEKREALLKMRTNPDLAINAGADYAAHNLAVLKEEGLIIDDSPAALARYAYLAHHEGLAGARKFLDGTGIYSRQKVLANFGGERATRCLRLTNNDASAAYRLCLSEYINERVDPTKYMKDSRGVQLPPMEQLVQSGR